MVIGFVVLLLALALVTTILDLKVLRWLLGTFSAFFAVAVLIIFQPELRRMLAELGNLPLFVSVSEQRESIEVIIQTVERLADVKIGALIAIEQSIQLQEAVESGIRVDCDATPEMLETIFFPNNAIHDGGVIIKGDRIAYAACIFPLTQRQDLNKSLGTRHRAAIGLSEETDAVIVVVSEETGMISHAYKGQLGARRVAGGVARVPDFRARATGQITPRRRMAARASQRTAQARFGRHHQKRTAPGAQANRQLNFYGNARLGHKRFRLEIVLAVSGGGHLADRS